MTDPAPKPRAGLARPLAIAGLIVLAALIALFLARRALVREALDAWLRSNGVPGEARIEGLGLNAATGAIRIGDPRAPDLLVPRVEIGYGLRGLSLEVRSVRLVRPVLRASLRGGRFSAGALDTLIARFASAPPRPGAPRPRIELTQGEVQLATDYGPLRLHGDATMAQGRLEALAVRVDPARLQGKAFRAELQGAAVRLTALGARAELAVDASLAQASAAGATAGNARVRLTAAGSYPDLIARRLSGPVAAHAELAADRLEAGGQTLRNALVSASFAGRAEGGLPDLALDGQGAADLRATAGALGGGTAGPLHVRAGLQALSWRRRGGDVLSGRLAASAELQRYVRDALGLSAVRLAAAGPVSLSAGAIRADLTASALGHGGWSGLAPPAAGETPQLAAVKRAARGFRFAAPKVAVRVAGPGVRFDLPQAVRLTPDAGGAVTLARRGAGWRLASAGGGLPTVTADLDKPTYAGGRGSARARVQAAASIGPVQQGVLDAAGTVAFADGTARFTAARCVSLGARRLLLGSNDLVDVAARLCPMGRPLLELGGGGWRLAARAESVSAAVPFLQVGLADGAGQIAVAAQGRALRAQLAVVGARVQDAAAQPRFNPVMISGPVTLADDVWRGRLEVRDLGGRRLGGVGLTHQGRSGTGEAAIDTGLLRFAPGGLQPAELSPLAAAVGSPAQGSARFAGGLHWSPAGVGSGGVLDVPGLDFQSPAGRIAGLTGQVTFLSLAPLAAAPGQTLRVASLTTPLGEAKDLQVAFGLAGERLEVSGGEASFGGGRVRIESLSVPFAAGQPLRGVVALEGVQLHDLVEASPFGGRVDLQARVSGRIPFSVAGGRVRVTGGALRAIEPGRLSIQRAALTTVAASGGPELPATPPVAAPASPAAPAAPPGADAFSDFAYQAMENLAFSTLEAGVDSKADGRLGVLFHIIGEHDPPTHQEIRLSVFDLIGRKFLNRPLPLPSGTKVNLTLDTTLNLDDLLNDYAEFRRLHGSAAVQP